MTLRLDYRTLIEPVAERAKRDPDYPSVVLVGEDGSEETVSAAQFLADDCQRSGMSHERFVGTRGRGGAAAGHDAPSTGRGCGWQAALVGAPDRVRPARAVPGADPAHGEEQVQGPRSIRWLHCP